MKDSWERKRISEFAEVISGGTPSTSVEEFWNGDVVWITPSDLSKIKYPKIDSSIKKITDLGLNNSSANLIPARSIVMSSRAPIGYFAIPTIDFSTNQGCKSIKLNNQQDELFHYYNFLFNVEAFKKKGEGTTFAEISKKEIEKLDFKFPPLPQQRKIAQILSTVDAVLEKTEAAIAKYQQLKQGLMHDVFTRGIDINTGQLRPKQTEAPERYKQSPLGWIPKEWEVEELGNVIIGKGDYGINAAAVNFDPKYHTYLRITDISDDGHFIEEGKKSVNHIEAKNFILEDGDIVFARTGNSTGKTYLYNRNDGVLVFAGFLIRFKPDSSKLNSMFLKFITETPYYKNWVSVYSARTGQPGINGNEYSKLSFVLPSIEEQNQIAQKLQSIHQKIHTEQQALAKYQQLKAGLLQDLLTGRVAVNV